MALKLKEGEKQVLEGQGYVSRGASGGPNKSLYYTPDGREVWAIPAHRVRVRKFNDGRPSESFTVDANFDNGWLPSPPTGKLQKYCKGCDKWHPTQKRVDTCIAERQKKQQEWDEKAMRELHKDKPKDDSTLIQDTSALAGRVDAIERQLAKLDSIEELLRKMPGGNGG